jgi:4-amino-4-deoxy-L-arabinose transferase-like glycosyltransferase
MQLSKRHWHISILLLLIIVTFFIRFYDLPVSPPGLHYDEGFNGLDGYQLLSIPLSQWPIFFTGNFGREPLLIYLLAAVQMVFPASPGTLRLVTASIGVLLTFALMGLGYELAATLGLDNKRYLFWSGAAALALLWSQIFSRYVIRAELFALIEVLLFACLWRAWRTGRWYWWAVAGFWAGLSLYTYIPARIIPVVLIPFLFWALWRYRTRLSRNLAGISLGLIIAGIVAAPILIYFWQNPVSFWTRTEQVSLLHQGGIKALLINAKLVLGMAFITGDQNIRYNIPGRPVFDPLMVGPFLVGLVFMAHRWRRPAVVFLFMWLMVMLTPTIFSEDAPSFQRAIGAMPAFILILALGLESITRWLENHSFSRIRKWAALLVALLVALSITITVRAYATQWATPQTLFYARDIGFMRLGKLITSEFSSGDRVYLSPRGKDHPTLRYSLLDDKNLPEIEGFDGRLCLRVATNRQAEYIFLSQEDFRGPDLLASYLANTKKQTIITAPDGQPWAVSLTQSESDPVQFPEMTAYPVKLGDGIELLGYWLSQSEIHPGDHLYVRLFWRVTDKPQKNYTNFVHIIDTQPGETVILAGNDGAPGNGSCMTTEWLPGEIVVDEKEIVLPETLTIDDHRGEYFIETGFYTLEDGQRLSIPEHKNDRILIGPLEISE